MLQSESSEGGRERLYLEARDEMSEVGTMDSCLYGWLVGVVNWDNETYCAAPRTETDILADLD